MIEIWISQPVSEGYEHPWDTQERKIWLFSGSELTELKWNEWMLRKSLLPSAVQVSPICLSEFKNVCINRAPHQAHLQVNTNYIHSMHKVNCVLPIKNISEVLLILLGGSRCMLGTSQGIARILSDLPNEAIPFAVL